MHHQLIMKIPYSADHFSKHSLNNVYAQDVAVVTGYIKQITTRAVRQNQKRLGLIVVKSSQMNERRVRDRAEHLHFSLET